MFKNSTVVKFFALVGAILLPIALISAFSTPPIKVVYQDRLIKDTKYVNMNVVVHGMSINTVILALYNDPVEYKKIFDFYNTKVKNAEITEVILRKALEYGVPVNVAFGMAYQESRFDPVAKNHNDNGTWDFGLFQGNTADHPTWTRKDFFNPEKNADAAMNTYSKRLTKHSTLALDLALVDYNAGINSLPRKRIPYITSMHVFYVREYERQLDLEFCKYLIPMLNAQTIDFTKLD